MLLVIKLLLKTTLNKLQARSLLNAAEVNTNLGLCELVKGNVADAETYSSKSTGANTANEALGNLYIKQGQMIVLFRHLVAICKTN